MIAVVVLTFNGKKYLSELFASLEKMVCAEPWKLFVVDNASTDGTADVVGKLQTTNYKLQTILNSENFGFAEGNNVGMRAALDEGADFIVLLNQDTVVDPSWLDHMVSAMRADPTIGAVQARLMLWPEKEKVNSLGNEIHYLGFGYSGGYKKKLLVTSYQLPVTEIAYASGAAVMYRASALRDVGLLDASLFLYHEDLDLGWRLWMARWKSVLAPDAVVYHKYEFSRSIKKYYYMERNRFLVLLELYRIPTLLLILPALVVMEIGLSFQALIAGWGGEKLRVYAFFLNPRSWQIVLRARKEKQKKRRVSDRGASRLFTGVIASQEIRQPFVTYVMNPLFLVYWRIVRMILFW